MEQKESYINNNDIQRAVSYYVTFIRRPDLPPPTWPAFIEEPKWYLCKYFLRNLYETIIKLRKVVNDDKIAELFRAPSRIGQYLFLLSGFGFSDLTAQEKIELIKSLLKYMGYYRKRDVFCTDRQNMIWNFKKVNEMLDRGKIFEIKENPKLARTIGRINVALWMYCQFINVMYHAMTHEFHGPYSIDKGEEFLLIREYYELRPTPVWSFTSDFLADKITILEIYKNIKIGIDPSGHIEHFDSLPAHLLRVSIFVNDSPVNSFSDIKNLLENCSIIFNKANDFTRNFNKYDWMKKIVKMHYYFLKPHKDVLGENWEPPKAQILLCEKEPTQEYYDFLDKFGSVFMDSTEKGFQGLEKLVMDLIYK